MKDPPKIDWVAIKFSDKSMASVINPLFDLTATRAAISFPRAEVEINNALGECEARTDATASAMAGIPCLANSALSAIKIFSISKAFN